MIESSIPVWISIIGSIIFGASGISCFYFAIKKYKEDSDFFEVFSYVDGIFAILGVLIEAILWLCKKVFPPSLHLIAFRSMIFFIGLITIGLIPLFWIL